MPSPSTKLRSTSRTCFRGSRTTTAISKLCSTMIVFLSLRRTVNAFVVPSRSTAVRLLFVRQPCQVGRTAAAATTTTAASRLWSSSTATEESQASSSTPAAAPVTYPFAEVEPKWQAYWEEHQTFKTPERDTSKPKKYVLDMFPYPSGAGLHVGHPEGYTGKFLLLWCDNLG